MKHDIGENLYWTTVKGQPENIIENGIKSWASELKSCGFDYTQVGSARMLPNRQCKAMTILHWTQVRKNYF